MVGCILIEQGIGSWSKMPGRCVLGSWLLCTIILCTVYKGKLTSDMVNPPTEHLANLHEMGELGFHVYVHEVSTQIVIKQKTCLLSIESSDFLGQLFSAFNVIYVTRYGALFVKLSKIIIK